MMEIGKISENLLKQLVFGKLGTPGDCIILGSGVGEDCAALELPPGEVMVLSTDPITGTSKDIGSLACVVTFNDLASSGAKPIGILLTLLLPPETNEETLGSVMQDVDKTCKELGVCVMGGHTEVTSAVNKPLISVTGVGRVKREALISTAGAKPGMDLILTKWAGLEGTSIIAKEKSSELLKHFPAHMIESAAGFDKYISAVADGLAAAPFAGAMHDVTEGGVLGALWEVGEASKVGIEIDLSLVPLRQETIEITEFYNINPYKLISSGCMLIATDKKEECLLALENAGVSATVIGKCTGGKEKIARYDNNVMYLTPPGADELYKVV